MESYKAKRREANKLAARRARLKAKNAKINRLNELADAKAMITVLEKEIARADSVNKALVAENGFLHQELRALGVTQPGVPNILADVF